MPHARRARGTEDEGIKPSTGLSPVPLESGLRKSRITNNPAEVCPSGRSRRRSPAAFLAVPDGTMALARGGDPDGLRR